MHRKKLYYLHTVFSIILFIPFILNAQVDCKDTIHLKDGQVVCGTVMDIQKPLYVVLKVNDSVAYIYSWHKVKYVYSCPGEGNHLIPAMGMSGINSSKCFLSLELEETMIVSEIDTNTLNFVSTPKISMGFNFKHEISCGLGAGFFEYNHSSFIPLYAEFRKYYFGGSLAEPYFEGDAGYTVCIGPNGDRGGINANIRIGEKTPFIKGLDLFGSFGLGFQQYSFYQPVDGNNQVQQKSFLVLNLNVGVMIE
jgi:hypothetical protein